jgi:CDP-diacylglycerol--glycerol-3-phosphate 3-phosphatidyltransferase/cardiolipin synthase
MAGSKPVRWIALAVPTVLSGARLILAAAFPFSGSPGRAALVAGAAVSDGLDGLAARTLRSTTWWGGCLDAIADKLFTLAVLATFVVEGRLAVWEALLLLARDFAVLAVVLRLAFLRFWAGFRLVRARVLGKITTVCLYLLFFVLSVGPEPTGLHRMVVVAGLGFSVAAGVDYLRHSPRRAALAGS